MSRYLVGALVAAAVAVFAAQNTAPVSIRFAMWTLESVPIAALVLVPLALGIVVVGIPLWLQRWRLRARLRSTQARLDALERRRPPDAPSSAATS